MSVYKSKRSESSMQFVDTAKKLEAFTLSYCTRRPGRTRKGANGLGKPWSSGVR